MEMIYDEEYWEMLEGFVATHEIVIDRPKEQYICDIVICYIR